MVKDDYERMKDKESIIFITEDKYNCIPKNSCHIIYTKQFPTMKDLLKYCEEE